jgi:hypothetical protein
MGEPIIDDELWVLIEPLLQPARPTPLQIYGPQAGTDRAALSGTCSC